MKRIAGLLAGFLLLQVGGAFAQTSDYETIETFKKKNQSLLASIDAAQNPEQCAVLESEIGRLQSEYGQHRALLAEGLYPQTFETSIAALRARLREATERINLAAESRVDKTRIEEISRKVEADGKTIAEINKQNAEYRAAIDRLTQEVNDLSARIQKISEENTGLLAKIQALQLESKKDKESIARLKELTDKLNANIRDRDELVLKMMDSLFTEFVKAEPTDQQKKNLFVNVKGNDYVGRIITTIDGNVKYSQSGLLTPQDVKFVREEQKRLAAKWNEIKPFVAKLYPDEQTRVRDIATVDSRVSEWKSSIDDTTWKSIRQVFVGQNVDIGPFADAGEFHARLLAYIDAQQGKPSRDAYQTFKTKIWDSPIKDQWLAVIPLEELTEKQRAEIEERIALWDKNSAPLVPRWVLIGVLGAVLLGVLVVALRSRKRPAETA
jgi:uncharacterized coiled-coil protein SlyX